MSKERYYINTRGNDDDAYREAMRKACELANNDNDIKKVVLLIASKGNTGWFERLYGSDVEKKLFTGVRFKNCKPLFKFETVRNYSNRHTDQSEIVISCGLSDEELLPIDGYQSVKAIIAIPWLPEKLQKWVQTWSPIELRGQQDVAPASPGLSCIVKQALDELTGMINMTTGISHPMDEKYAKTFIRALHKYEDSLDANTVGAYLMGQLGWSAKHSGAVEKLINTLNEGRYFQGGEKTGLQIHYKRWKEDCKGS